MPLEDDVLYVGVLLASIAAGRKQPCNMYFYSDPNLGNVSISGNDARFGSWEFDWAVPTGQFLTKENAVSPVRLTLNPGPDVVGRDDRIGFDGHFS